MGIIGGIASVVSGKLSDKFHNRIIPLTISALGVVIIIFLIFIFNLIIIIIKKSISTILCSIGIRNFWFWTISIGITNFFNNIMMSFTFACITEGNFFTFYK